MRHTKKRPLFQTRGSKLLLVSCGLFRHHSVCGHWSPRPELWSCGGLHLCVTRGLVFCAHAVIFWFDETRFFIVFFVHRASRRRRGRTLGAGAAAARVRASRADRRTEATTIPSSTTRRPTAATSRASGE